MTDKINWTKIDGCFTAAGGEQYICIGNFKNDANSSIDSVGATGYESYASVTAAYYIDDVSVREINYAHAFAYPGKGTVICAGDSALIGADMARAGISYNWQPTVGLANPNAAQTLASPTVSTTYTLTVTNDSLFGCGCGDSVSTDTATIFICPPEILPDNVFIPTAFSPNGDGENDVLYARGKNIASFHIAIFDRWGNKVFETENTSMGWDGTYNGKPMETGTYSYYATGSYTDGNQFEKKGNITIVR